MKQAKILFLAVILLLTSALISCVPGAGQVARGWSGTAFHEGVIYTGTPDGRVVAINATSRDLQWSRSIVTESAGGLGCGPATVADAIYTTPIVDGEVVYIGTYSGKVLALNTVARSQDLTFPQRGYGEWEWVGPKMGAASNAIVADLEMSEDAIYVSSSNGRVYSLDKRYGDLNWESERLHDEKLWTSPVLHGDTLYVSTFGGHIYALSANTGGLLDWFFEAEAGFASCPAVYEGTIYVGSFDGYLYAVRTDSGELVWRFPEERPAGNWFWARPLVHEGVVYAGCLDGRLHAIDAETGKELWEAVDAASPIVASPIFAHNLLIIAAESGNVYVINPETGDSERIRNPYNADKPTINDRDTIMASLSACDTNVYIRGELNRVYAVNIDQREARMLIDLTA